MFNSSSPCPNKYIKQCNCFLLLESQYQNPTTIYVRLPWKANVKTDARQERLVPCVISGAPLVMSGNILMLCLAGWELIFQALLFDSVALSLPHPPPTCWVESCAPTGEGESVEVPGALRGHEERSGENDEKQRGRRQHFGCLIILSPLVEKLLKADGERTYAVPTLV